MALWLQAFLWGLLGGSALLIGAAIAFLAELPQRVIAGVMAFGTGVLISAVGLSCCTGRPDMNTGRPIRSKIAVTRTADIHALITEVNLSPGTFTVWDVGRRARELDPAIPVVYMKVRAATNGVRRRAD